MKKFTLIEADKYINIDGLGIFFTEENWPFADIEHLWAIQWKDDGTEDGVGEVEYDSGAVANTPATRAMIDRYVDHFNEEKERQTQERLKREEEEKKQALSWQEAMAELEGQMEEMQKRHDANLRGRLLIMIHKWREFINVLLKHTKTYSMVNKESKRISVRVRDLLNLKQDMRI